MFRLLPVIPFLFLVSCTEVTSKDGVDTLSAGFAATVMLPLAGVLLLVLGGFLYWKSIRTEEGVEWGLPTIGQCVLPAIGGVLLLVALPWLVYKIEVGADYIECRELGNGGHFSKKEIRRVYLEGAMPGKARRLHIITKNAGEFSINESEVGAESFDKIKLALEKFAKRTNVPFVGG